MEIIFSEDIILTITQITVAELLSLPIKKWEYNRDLCADRVEIIRRSLESKPMSFTPITLVNNFIIDGQHRIDAFKLLKNKSFSIILHYYKCTYDSDIHAIFKDINSGTPVSSIYYDVVIKKIIDEYIRFLNTEYGCEIVRKTITKRPYVYIGKIRDELPLMQDFKKAVSDGTITIDILKKRTIEWNNLTKFDIEKGIFKELSVGCLQSAHKSGFYLGLRDAWVHQLISYAIRNVQISI